MRLAMGQVDKSKVDLSKRRLFSGGLNARLAPEASDENLENHEQIVALSETCLAFQGVSCRACEDACMESAISFRPQLGGKEFPILDSATCTGCGECVPICPTSALSLVAKPQMDDPQQETVNEV